jgi:hypothetical protein
MIALECKSGATAVSEWISAPAAFKEIVKGMTTRAGVIFGGDESQLRSEGKFYSWREFGINLASKE